MNLTLYKILTFSLIVTTACTQNCEEEYDASRCTYNVFCIDSFHLEKQYYNYGIPNHSHLNGNILLLPCENSINVDNSYVQPFHLIYKITDPDNMNIIPYFSDQRHCQMITSLNISCNRYHHIPIFTEMNNLALLNISQNDLTEAYFSNKYELSSLVEIDFSHNTINDLLINAEEFVFRNLKRINLSHNYLVKIKEAIFDSFEELQFLDLSHNFINEITPLTFEGVMNLLYLNISHNRISDFSSSLFRFNDLKILQLNHNKLKDIKLGDLENLINMEILDLSSNSISVIEKNVFQNMQRLISLDLSDNLLEFIDKEIFSNVIGLTIINFSRNRFKNLPVSVFRGKRISSFFIQGNRFEGSIMKGVFEGLYLVTQLDLSSQYLSTLEDFAFIGLDHLETLLLNNNILNMLSKKSFRTLNKLRQLDLSNNQIINIAFDKDDLHSLQSLSLRNNYLIEVNDQHFQGLSLLQFLDLSNNNISTLEANAFISLRELINFEISNNPLSGTLEKNTFDGLNSLPNLDISCSLLITIQNNSLSGMIQLKTLNISHSKIRELQYNTFLHTGSIEVIDLSFNELDILYLNTTELSNLETLLLNNNLLTVISSSTFRGIPRLLKIILTSNNISQIENAALKDQRDLRFLDLSYNSGLIFNVTLINTMKTLNSLILSGIKRGFNLKNAGDVPLSNMEIAHLEVTDVKILKLNELTQLDRLILNNNNITKLEVGAFTNMTKLRNLDLSYNKISFIQSGAFKDNTLLYNLNISHNLISAITYGIFRGLIYLDTLDISYNKVNDLQSERFYEVSSLSVIKADYNLINSINAEMFLGTQLRTLSIGGNPLPCEMLVNLKRHSVPFEITAMKLNEKSDDENVDGVTCNMNENIIHKSRTEPYKTFVENDKILIEIRDILLSNGKKDGDKRNVNVITANNDTKTIIDIARNIEKTAIDINNKSSIINITSKIVHDNNNTNILLEKILKVLSLNVKRVTASPVITGNITNDNFTIYVNNMRKDIEDTIALEKQELISEIEKKIDVINSRIDSISNEVPKNEKFVSSETSKQSKSLFTETCVALILIILVSFILYKFYKSRIYIRNRLSISTRELPGAIENSTL